MASRWFDDFDDDFFTRPSRLSALSGADSWSPLERIHLDFGGGDIFSDFTTRAANLRNRVQQDRINRSSPAKKVPARRASGVSSDGIASPTPSSINSSAFQYPENNEGHVTFPASSCSNISDCSDKSPESVCTEKSASHSAVSEALPGGGEARNEESTKSWVDRNVSGGVVGQGKSSQVLKTESRPGSFQEYARHEASYVGVGANDLDTYQSVSKSEERSAKSDSWKSQISSSSTTKNFSTSNTYIGGKPFKAPPNRSLFYDELDSSQVSCGRGLQRRISPLDKLLGLVDQVVHQDRLFQSEIDEFFRDRTTSVRKDSKNTTESHDKVSGRPLAKTDTDELKAENEALKQENSHLQQVLQEVTAVNKRWQRYNTDRRMYVQKLLATIQDLQEQMNDRGESALQRNPAAASEASVERHRKEYEEEAKLLRLQIKSYKDDCEFEHRERKKAIEEKEKVETQLKKLREEMDLLKNLPSVKECTCDASKPTTHVASQDFKPRTCIFVPYSPDSNSCSEESSINISEQNNLTRDEKPMNSWDTNDSYESTGADGRSLFLGYPDNGRATVVGFTPNIHPDAGSTDRHLTCPNCFRVFPLSRRVCFMDHFEFCQSTDSTNPREGAS